MECLECKKIVKSIGYLHLKYCCGLTPKEYKIKHNVASLVDEDVKLKSIKYGKDNGSYKPEKRELSEFIKTCESCGERTKMKSYDGLQTANKRHTCIKCADRSHWIGRKHSEETKTKISIANKGKSYNKSRLGIQETIETRKRKSKSLKGRTGGFVGKKHSEGTKEKLRLARLKDIDSKYPLGWTSPNYNVRACEMFNEINSSLNWNGIHAENVGEFRVCGFLVDFYEPTKNVVIEFDEPYHDNQKDKDKFRQNIITKKLGCKFYRIEEANWRDIIT